MSAVTPNRRRSRMGVGLGSLTTVIGVRELGLAAIMVLVSVVAALTVPAFRSGENIGEVLNDAAIYVILAIGETLVLLTRQIDLSVGATLGLASFLTAEALSSMSGLGPVGAIVLAVSIGAVMGLGNGLLVDLARMPAIIATLATLSIYSGLQVIVSGGAQIDRSQLPSWLAQLFEVTWLGVPSFIVIAIVVVVVFAAILRLTRWGRDLYAMGSHPEAARNMGIPTRRRTYEAFIVCGGLAGFGGLLYAAQFGGVDATAGGGFNLTVIAGAVVGGVSLFGGAGSALGAALGSLLLVEIGDILALLKISIFAQQTLQGIAIVAAVAVYAVLARRLQRPAARGQYLESETHDTESAAPGAVAP